MSDERLAKATRELMSWWTSETQEFRDLVIDLLSGLPGSDALVDSLGLVDLSDQEKEQIEKLNVRAFLATEFKPADERAFGPVESLNPDADDSPQFVCVLHVWREESDQ